MRRHVYPSAEGLRPADGITAFRTSSSKEHRGSAIDVFDPPKEAVPYRSPYNKETVSMW